MEPSSCWLFAIPRGPISWQTICRHALIFSAFSVAWCCSKVWFRARFAFYGDSFYVVSPHLNLKFYMNFKQGKVGLTPFLEPILRSTIEINTRLPRSVCIFATQCGRSIFSPVSKPLLAPVVRCVSQQLAELVLIQKFRFITQTAAATSYLATTFPETPELPF